MPKPAKKRHLNLTTKINEPLTKNTRTIYSYICIVEKDNRSHELKSTHAMPHIAVTMLPGRTPEQKRSLARKLQQVLSRELELENMQVSVSVEDLPFEGWGEFLNDLPQESILIPEETSGSDLFNDCRCSC